MSAVGIAGRCLQYAEFAAQILHLVQLFPPEEFDFFRDFPAMVEQGDLPAVGAVAEVTVGGRRFEDGVLETEPFHDGGGTQVEKPFDAAGYLGIGVRYAGRAVSIHIDAERMCDAYRVGELDEYLVGDACCHHVLGDVAGRIGVP